MDKQFIIIPESINTDKLSNKDIIFIGELYQNEILIRKYINDLPVKKRKKINSSIYLKPYHHLKLKKFYGRNYKRNIENLDKIDYIYCENSYLSPKFRNQSSKYVFGLTKRYRLSKTVDITKTKTIVIDDKVSLNSLKRLNEYNDSIIQQVIEVQNKSFEMLNGVEGLDLTTHSDSCYRLYNDIVSSKEGKERRKVITTKEGSKHLVEFDLSCSNSSMLPSIISNEDSLKDDVQSFKTIVENGFLKEYIQQMIISDFNIIYPMEEIKEGLTYFMNYKSGERIFHPVVNKTREIFKTYFPTVWNYIEDKSRFTRSYLTRNILTRTESTLMNTFILYWFEKYQTPIIRIHDSLMIREDQKNIFLSEFKNHCSKILGYNVHIKEKVD